MNLEAIAYCGVDCAACPDLRNQKCPGCRQTAWTPDDICMPVECCRKQGIRVCGECPTFPCADMRDFYEESDSHRAAYNAFLALDTQWKALEQRHLALRDEIRA